MIQKNVKLSKLDYKTLDFIKTFTLEHQVTPTIREIAEGIGRKGVSAAHLHFKKLVRNGDIIPYGDNTFRYSVKGLVIREGEIYDESKICRTGTQNGVCQD